MLSLTLAALKCLIATKVVQVIQVCEIHMKLQLRVRSALNVAHSRVLFLCEVFIYVRYRACCIRLVHGQLRHGEDVQFLLHISIDHKLWLFAASRPFRLHSKYGLLLGLGLKEGIFG